MKLLRWGVGVVGVAMLAIAVAHVPPVSAWLGWNHHGSGGCPFGHGGGAHVAQRPHAPVDSTAPVAKSRPAIGFALAHATREQVLAWAWAHGSPCTSMHGGTELECPHLPLGDTTATVWFDLAGDVLVSVRTVRRAPNASAVASAFATATATVTAEAGAPARLVGRADTRTLVRGTLAQATAEYEFRDYRARIRATNLGDGYALTESYTAL